MGKIIQIGKAKIERVRSGLERCRHRYFKYDPDGRTIECQDCQKILDPFDAFVELAHIWEEAYTTLENRQKELEELEARREKGLLRATRRVDEAWRSRSMVPVCPHCKKPIFPEDGFGTSAINKEMALEARKFKKTER